MSGSMTLLQEHETVAEVRPRKFINFQSNFQSKVLVGFTFSACPSFCRSIIPSTFGLINYEAHNRFC